MNKENANVNMDETVVQEPAPVVKEAPAKAETIFAHVTLPKGYKELNVRAEAKGGSKVLYTVKDKAKLKIEELVEAPEWVKVIAKDGTIGYCMKKYVTIK